MKRLLVLKQIENPTPSDTKRVKKLAKQIKKSHDLLWGKGSCQVVVIEHGQYLELAAEDRESIGSSWAGLGTTTLNNKTE